jgi:hypothetical protein
LTISDSIWRDLVHQRRWSAKVASPAASFGAAYPKRPRTGTLVVLLTILYWGWLGLPLTQR